MTTTPTSSRRADRTMYYTTRLTHSQARFIRDLPNRHQVITTALAQPLPVEAWIESCRQGRLVAEAVSPVLKSRAARDRARTPEALENRRAIIVDRCLKRLPRGVDTLDVIDGIEEYVREYVRLEGGGRAWAGTGRTSLDLPVPRSALANLRITAKALRVPLAFLIRSMIATYVEGAREKGGYVLPGAPFSTSLERREETLELMLSGLETMAANERRSRAREAARAA